MYPKPTDAQLTWFTSLIVTDPESGCWVWTGRELGKKRGYGGFGKNIPAHRLAYEWLGGGEIPPGLSVLHSCDNPPCVNPHHLRPGTDTENRADAFGRDARPLSRLEMQAVLGYAKRHSTRSTASLFNLSTERVSKLKWGTDGKIGRCLMDRTIVHEVDWLSAKWLLEGIAAGADLELAAADLGLAELAAVAVLQGYARITCFMD